MTDLDRLDPVAVGPGRGGVLAAWERFVQGDDPVPGVRPQVAISWHRCREKYRVDPHLTEAPAAPAEVDHSLEHDVIFTELGGLAMSAARKVEGLSGIVTVTDAGGCVASLVIDVPGDGRDVGNFAGFEEVGDGVCEGHVVDCWDEGC